MNPELPFVARWRNAVRDSGLPRTTKLVAHTLSTYMDGDGMTGPETRKTPSIITLARGASLGRETQKDNTAVKEAIERLELEGLLVVDRRRGQRGWTYSARIPRVGEGFESPAGTGESSERIPRGRENESPALASGIPRRGGGEVERKRSKSDDDVVASEERDSEDLDAVLAPLGLLTAAQHAKFKSAWTARPEGVAALVDEVLRGRNVHSRAALFDSWIAEGAHLTIEVEPEQEPQRPLEPCAECGNFHGHDPGCARNPAGAVRRGVCAECGVGGGQHADYCERVPVEAGFAGSAAA